MEGLPAPERKPPEDVPAVEKQRISEPIPIRRAGKGGEPDARADEQARVRPPHRVGAGERSDISSKRRRAADTRGNYRITEADELETGGKVTKFDRNISAIKLLKQIESETRKASPEEQKSLVKYSSWGGIPKVFNRGLLCREKLKVGHCIKRIQTKILHCNDQNSIFHFSN